MAAEEYIAAMKALKEAEANGDIEAAYAGTNKAATTRARKAFLKAKKAFHTARQEIQAIKSDEEEPVKGVPSFFEVAE